MGRDEASASTASSARGRRDDCIDSMVGVEIDIGHAVRGVGVSRDILSLRVESSGQARLTFVYWKQQQQYKYKFTNRRHGIQRLKVRLDVQAKDKPDRSGTPVIQLGKIEAWMERKNDCIQSDRNVRRFASHSIQHSRLFV